jgi:hypothetical protein
VSQAWRPDKRAREWPNRRPVWTWMPVFVALASMLAICMYHYIAVCTPLQRFYLMAYIRSGLRSATTFAKTGQYELLAVTTKNRSHWAYDGEVAEAKTESGEATVRLTQEALKTGALHLVLLPVQSDDAKMHEFLRHAIYREQTLMDLLRPALWGPLAALLLWLAFTLIKDAARARGRREGGRLKWSWLVFPQFFNRRNHSDGTGFELSGGKLPVVGLPKRHPTHIEGSIEVKPEELPNAVATTLTAEDGVDREIALHEKEQHREHKLSRRPARKERYFQ